MVTTLSVVANDTYSKLAAGITDVATSMTVTTGEGANFPSTYPFYLSIEDEIVKVTNRATDTMTIVRAQENTAGVAHVVARSVSLNIISKHITDLNTAVNAMEVMTTRGDMIFRNATVWARLAKGVDNTIMAMGANDPEWKTPAAILADLDAGLSNLAGVAMAADKFYYTSADNTHVAASVTAFARSILDDANEATFKATVNLEIGTDVLAEQTIGIADDNLLEVDGSPNDNEYAKFTANGIEGRTYAEVLGDLTGANLDVGAFDVRGQTLTADALTSGRVVFAGASGVLSDDSDFTFATDTLTVTKIGAFQATGAINFDNQALTNVYVHSGDISAMTVGGSLTWNAAQNLNSQALTNVNIDSGDISAATISGGLTWSSAQNLNSQALTNVNIDSGDISAVTISGSLTWSAVQNLNSQALTNVNIDSGTIDGVTITSPALSGTTSGTFTVGGTVTINAFTLGGTITGASQSISDIGMITFTSAYGIASVSDSGTWTMRGGTQAAGSGSVLFMYGKSHGSNGAFIIGTPDDAETADVTRLTISGDAGTATATWSDIVHTGLTMSGGVIFNNDVPVTFGANSDSPVRYETADGNALAIVWALPHVDEDANNVAVLALVDRDRFGVDLGFFNGITEPTLAIENEAGDAYVSLDAGDIDGTENGLYFNPAADEQVTIIKLGVTGTPTIVWNETGNSFRIDNADWEVPGDVLCSEVRQQTGAGMDITDVKMIKFKAETDLTISAGGAVAVTQTYHSIIVNGGTGAGNDDLSTATGGAEGKLLILKPNTSGGADTVTVKNGTGAGTFILAGGADFAMNHIDDRLTLLYNGTEWVELSRSDNS